MKNFKDTLNIFCKDVADYVTRELASVAAYSPSCGIFGDALKAFNTYQEQECDGANYIFDLRDKEDLICCIKGGMTAKEIAKLWQNSFETHTPYFKFDESVPEGIYQFETNEEIKSYIMGWVDEFVPFMIAYPKTYDDLYYKIISDYMADTNLL